MPARLCWVDFSCVKPCRTEGNKRANTVSLPTPVPWDLRPSRTRFRPTVASRNCVWFIGEVRSTGHLDGYEWYPEMLCFNDAFLVFPQLVLSNTCWFHILMVYCSIVSLRFYSVLSLCVFISRFCFWIMLFQCCIYVWYVPLKRLTYLLTYFNSFQTTLYYKLDWETRCSIVLDHHRTRILDGALE